jgi:DNA polymerase (family 10)
MDRAKVAEILVEIGTLLELKGENPFKTRAYLNAARVVEGLDDAAFDRGSRLRRGRFAGIREHMFPRTPDNTCG